jgi:hypothetical protein
MEACESGSMFANLPNNIGIYATSAASNFNLIEKMQMKVRGGPIVMKNKI